MRKSMLSLLVLASILLGALAAGSAVNGDPTVAKSVAGIELGAHAPSAPRHEAATAATVAPQNVLLLLVVLLGVGAFVATREERWDKARSVLRSKGSARRGPPALA